MLGVAVALVLSVAAGGPATADARSLETITIATPPFEPTALAFYADARGFFRKHGIEAKIVVLPDPGAVAAAPRGRRREVRGRATSVGSCSGESHGLPVKARGCGGNPTEQTAPYGRTRLCTRGNGFVRARKLVGKAHAVLWSRTGSIAHVALLKWLKRRRRPRGRLLRLSYHALPGHDRTC